MLKLKHIICVLILIGLAGCKTSPAADGGQALAIVPAPTSETSVPPVSAEPDPEPEPDPDATLTSTANANAPSSSSEKTVYTVQAGEFNLYPRETNGWDETGWSVITPSEDSRLIYVSSSSGNDATAEFYAPRDVASVEDPGAIKPYKTIEAAMLNARDGYPDWVLLRRGDAWELQNKLQLNSGRSISERAVITSYGTGHRPLIKSNADEALVIWSYRRYLAITSLAIYAHKRDPASAAFSGWGQVAEAIAIRMYAPQDSAMGTVLLENNDINYFSKGIAINGGGDILDIVIRRNTIRNSYSENDHSQGIYASHTSVLLEENIFDHNGWYKPQVGTGNEKSEGQANMFNHNTYFSQAFHTKFIRNIFLRSSSIQNKWAANSDKSLGVDSITANDLWMEDNVYVGGEIGISAGGNTDYNTGARWKNITILNNVMLAIGRDQPTNRTLGWNIDATDWDGGLICGNYLLHTDNPLVTNLSGIRLAGHSNDVTIAENTLHGLVAPNPNSKVGAISVDSAPKSNILITQNNVQLANSNMRVVVASQLDGLEFESNRYFSGLDETQWFRAVDVNYDIDAWRSISGDINSSVGNDSFMEPKRTFESYLSSIGVTPSIDVFLDNVVAQSKDNWRRDLSAQAILEYIREGYGNTRCTH